MAESAKAETKNAGQSASKPKTTSKRFKKKDSDPAEVVRKYFEAVDARDLDAMTDCWANGGIESIAPIGELRVPEELRAFFGELFAAVPDGRLEVLDFIGEGDKVCVRWRSRGTFCGSPFQGIEANGKRVELEGCDLLTVEDGLIRRNDAYYDGTQFARQIGLLPAKDSSAERVMATAFNARTRVTKELLPHVERAAEGVWLVRGGLRNAMNVFLIEDEGDVTVFDAGIESMTKRIAAAAGELGEIKRVVLSHAHADHRGAAVGLGAPVFCHPDEVSDAEGDGGRHYYDYSKMERRLSVRIYPYALGYWDGGPVKIEGTVKEGDEVAGFKVIHLPGHAPGLIGLWRESDRVALVSDTLYTGDAETWKRCPPRVAHPTFNKDTEQARASILKLAKLEPSLVWLGHGEPITGDVRSQLERAAREP